MRAPYKFLNLGPQLPCYATAPIADNIRRVKDSGLFLIENETIQVNEQSERRQRVNFRENAC